MFRLRPKPAPYTLSLVAQVYLKPDSAGHQERLDITISASSADANTHFSTESVLKIRKNTFLYQASRGFIEHNGVHYSHHSIDRVVFGPVCSDAGVGPR